MSTLISIDNGGTLTDVVVIAGDDVHRVKTLTTPSDLSQCFFDGLRKASQEVYGTEDVARLLVDCDLLRYSTTQGTNALVQREGPRVGLLVSAGFDLAALHAGDGAQQLLDDLVGDRVARLDAAPGAGEAELRAAVLAAVNALTAAGSTRIVVALDGAGYAARERTVKRLALEGFPSHLLGTVPLGFSHETVEDDDAARRTWTAVLNAFLHPAMERFLFHADHRLRRHRVRTPLLVFRNDGGSARVARTPALRSYSSGPRGGLEGVRALAAHYGLDDVVSVDVGGTTSDVGRLRGGEIRERRLGAVEGVATSFPLPDLVSLGVGGGSIIAVRDGAVRVGPQSVRAAPGPACFGLGGEDATITDALLLAGLLEPETYFGGALRIDRERAAEVVGKRIAEPLGVGLDEAVAAMIDAWVGALDDGIAAAGDVGPDTVLAAFGGAGPMLIAAVAQRLGIARVLVPRTAAVFSAFGIGFSDVAYEHHASLPDTAPETVAQVRAALLERAARDMAAEGAALEDCTVDVQLLAADGELVRRVAVNGELPAQPGTLAVRVAKPTHHPQLRDAGAAPHAAAPAGTRTVQGRDLGVHRVAALQPGATVDGPAVFEEELFTGLLPEGWRIAVSPAGDLWLERSA
ncbi:MAG TPA: hydantoinase/oxoprolinase family protein [Baekduia sp.]|nr:hydantoinase/oxoprolinase family protein [Baekduia sp.]